MSVSQISIEIGQISDLNIRWDFHHLKCLKNVRLRNNQTNMRFRSFKGHDRKSLRNACKAWKKNKNFFHFELYLMKMSANVSYRLFKPMNRQLTGSPQRRGSKHHIKISSISKNSFGRKR